MTDSASRSGTITFLFTDIEGSTLQWERDAAATEEALARHDQILRAAIENHGGRVFKTVGAAFCAVFTGAPSTIEATLEAQRRLREAFSGGYGPAGVRMAVHTAEAEVRENDYFGRAVNRVARILGIGHGGQILVSGSARELLHGSLPESAELLDLAEHRLKDLERPEHVYQLVHSDLWEEHPPLRSLDHLPHNLPIQLTSFVGRESEISEIGRGSCWPRRRRRRLPPRNSRR